MWPHECHGSHLCWARDHLLSVHGSKMTVFHGKKWCQNHMLFMYKIDKSEKHIFFTIFQNMSKIGSKKGFNHAGDLIFNRYIHIQKFRSK